ncbi:MAG: class I SAM-dependent methyltransferase [Lachnospiraceae bacterium]|nr:class I SAM-dependent methyltransferase [Lachnospiraceae bacterium]
MLDSKGFDLWADGYDKSVGLSEEDNSYPFAGYKKVLSSIYNTVLCREKPTVLDIGFGTGTLTAKLYAHGCEIYGQDFSDRMIALAKEKMPDAHLCQGDFSQGLAVPLLQKSYDFIIATYSLHHLTDAQKITFLRSLRGLLAEGGMILIGDVAFQTKADMEACRQAVGEEWDDEEFYFVAEELQKEFPDIRFEEISYCSGVFILPNA